MSMFEGLSNFIGYGFNPERGSSTDERTTVYLDGASQNRGIDVVGHENGPRWEGHPLESGDILKAQGNYGIGGKPISITMVGAMMDESANEIELEVDRKRWEDRF